jgi:uncharacterized protein (TIGR02145 family)
MKALIILSISFFVMVFAKGQNVGIGTNAPTSSAALDVTSTTKGFLPPRMTIIQRNAILSPVAGLMIWCIDYNRLHVYDGTTWQELAWVIPANLQSVIIGTQIWSLNNLDVVTYRNGDSIPKVSDPTEWSNLTTGAYCYYNNDSASYASVYGKLYNWYAVTDPRGLVPAGWHIPTDIEWTTLTTFLGGESIAGEKLKEAGLLHWVTPNSANNSSGFTALPGGGRSSTGSINSLIGERGYWWSATEQSTINAWPRSLVNSTIVTFRTSANKKSGFSVRCIKN